MDYAHLVDLRDAPLPDYMTDWIWRDPTSDANPEQAVIRSGLVRDYSPRLSIAPGETVRGVFYLLNLRARFPSTSTCW
jgi:hypothetical protein